MRQADRRAKTTATLLETAAAVFAEYGYERASLDAIVHEAGYSKGALYANFRSKLDLFEAVAAGVGKEAEVRTCAAAEGLAAGVSAIECANRYCEAPGIQRHAQLVAESWRVARVEERIRARLTAARRRRFEILLDASAGKSPAQAFDDAALVAKLIDAELVTRCVELAATA